MSHISSDQKPNNQISFRLSETDKDQDKLSGTSPKNNQSYEPSLIIKQRSGNKQQSFN